MTNEDDFYDKKTFHAWDYVVFSVVLAISAGIGLFHACSGGRQRSTSEFMLADRSMPAFPVALSVLVSFFRFVRFFLSTRGFRKGRTILPLLSFSPSLRDVCGSLSVFLLLASLPSLQLKKSCFLSLALSSATTQHFFNVHAVLPNKTPCK